MIDKTNREYIVARQPSCYQGCPINIIHIVISREELNKKIEDYFNEKIERDWSLYAPIDLFNHLVRNRKTYSYEKARRRACYLNKKYAKDKQE